MQAGDTARRSREITARDIELFTELTGDRNPLHYDEEAASRSRFGGIIVQGGVTSGLLNAVVAEDLPGPGSVFLEVAWKFLAPVRPGDVITADDLPAPLRPKEAAAPSGETRDRSLKDARDNFERSFILAELKTNDWNMTRTADRLGIERSHLYRKLRAYNINPPKRDT